MINFQTSVNENGNIRQLQIDVENRTLKSGYNLFIYHDVKRLTRAQLDDIKQAFIDNGFTDLNEK